MLDVFGDESASGDFVSYAVVCAPSNEAAGLGREIAALKARHGLTNLHCRVLFDARQRAKRGIEGMTSADVIAIYEEVADITKGPNVRTVVAQGQLSHFPGEQPADEHFPKTKFDEKSLGVACALSALIPIRRDFVGEELRVWPGHDGTKTEWLGKMRQPSEAIGGFYDIEGARDRVSPTPASEMPQDGRGELFEVADAIAWLANRVATEKNLDWRARYGVLLQSLFPMRVRLGLQMAEDGVAGMASNVPYEWPVRPG